MSNQIELMVEERVISGKKVKHLRQQGIVPANMYGHNLASVQLQVNAIALKKLIERGGNNVILSLKVGNEPAVQALIQKVQRNPMTREATHVDFYQVAATETLKAHVQLHFVNEVSLANLSGATVLRSLKEVLVECLPADLPDSIQVDLSQLSEVGAVIRVENLVVGSGVTILTDSKDMVAGLQQNARAEKADEVEATAEVVAAAPEAPARRGNER